MTCCWEIGDGFPMWMMPVGALFMLVFWGAIIFLVVWAVRSFVRQGRGAQPRGLYSRRAVRPRGDYPRAV
jgi:hypothetical protein